MRSFPLSALSLIAVSACAPAPLPDHIEQIMPVEVTATYRERIALPPGHTLIATIQDVSRADAPATVVAQKALSLDGLSPPYKVSLEVSTPGSFENSGTRLAARAEIRDSAGKLRFTTDTHHGVLTMGQPASASIVMVGVP